MRSPISTQRSSDHSIAYGNLPTYFSVMTGYSTVWGDAHETSVGQMRTRCEIECENDVQRCGEDASHVHEL